MNTKLCTSPLLILFAFQIQAGDIVFTNQTATFTNLEGRIYTKVTLLKANDYGLVWKGDGMGMVPYTNLAPAFLTSLGIGYERVQQAKTLADRQARADAAERAKAAAEAADPVSSFARRYGIQELKTEADLAKNLGDPVTIEGHLIQTISEDKSLVMVTTGTMEGNVVLIMADTKRVADGTTVVDSDAYRCGSYSYTTVGGSKKEIDRYGSRKRALSFLRWAHLDGPKPTWLDD
jgi:hypothetical protein